MKSIWVNIIIIRTTSKYSMNIQILQEIKITSAETTLRVHKIEIGCAFLIVISSELHMEE